MQKPILFEESTSILRQFQSRFRPQGLPPKQNEIAVRLVAPLSENAEPELEIVVLNESEAPAGEIPQAFEFEWAQGKRPIATRVVKGTLPKAGQYNSSPAAPTAVGGRVCGGDRVAGRRMTSGTVGWFFYLDGELMGISNWHVVVKPETARVSCGTTRQFADGVVVWDSPVYPYPATNQWDLSLVKMNVADVRAEMENLQTYPASIAQDPALGDGALYATVGAGHAGTSQGRLVSIWSGYVDYGYDWAYFAEQLEFDAPTQAGDSGSVIIRLADHAVAGVVFASYPTLANPLWKLGWRGWNGQNRLQGFPMFAW